MQRINSSVTSAAGNYTMFPLGCIYLSSPSVFFALELCQFLLVIVILLGGGTLFW
jgi:hypothetical protein